jgi:hypothetical protein
MTGPDPLTPSRAPAGKLPRRFSAVLASLEPDFFPVLLDQIGAKRDSTPPFARALRASSAELDQLVVTASNDPAVPAPIGHDGWVNLPIVLAFLCVVYTEEKRRRK